jgi:hypothetical protein
MRNHQGSFCRIFPVNEKQRYLTRQKLAPIIDDLVLELEQLRLAIDQAVDKLFAQQSYEETNTRNGDPEVVEQRFLGAALTKIVQKHFGNVPPDLARYPIGYCAEITLAGFDYIIHEGYRYSVYFRHLLSFSREGGVCKIIWGSLRGLYFQTALQVGALYVDIANDTVDPGKPKVEWSLLETSEFKNIDTIGEFAEVKSIYHGVDLYWNDFIPAIFPYCPLIEICPSRRTVSVVIIKDIISLAINGPFESVFRDFGVGSVVNYANNGLVSSLTIPLTGSETSINRLSIRRMDRSEMERLLVLQNSASAAQRQKVADSCRSIARFFNLAWMRASAFERTEPSNHHACCR